MKKLVFIIAVILAVAACGQHATPVRDTIPLVKQIVEDTTGVFSLVRQYRTSGTAGSIAIIGETENALLLAREFLAADRVDNIDGLDRPDRLPDFAGEEFDVFFDSYNEPFLRMAVTSPDSLREAAVRDALMALDSVAYANAYDQRARLAKNRAKLLVLASSVFATYGQFDIDTLLKMAGREPLILNPVEAVVSQVSGMSRVAVWAPLETRPAYEEAAARLSPGLDLVVLSPSERDERASFRDLLRQYREARPGMRMEALILDGFSADLDALSAEKEHIYRKITEEDMSFDRILAPEFKFIEPKSCLVSACYRLLRERNLFTHDIAYPSARYFQTEEAADGYCVPVEISSSYVAGMLPDSGEAEPSEDLTVHVPNHD